MKSYSLILVAYKNVETSFIIFINQYDKHFQCQAKLIRQLQYKALKKKEFRRTRTLACVTITNFIRLFLEIKPRLLKRPNRA